MIELEIFARKNGHIQVLEDGFDNLYNDVITCLGNLQTNLFSRNGREKRNNIGTDDVLRNVRREEYEQKKAQYLLSSMNQRSDFRLCVMRHHMPAKQ